MEEVLIITGGSKGIGEGIVKAYVAKGVKVFSVARTSNALLTLKGVSQIAFDLAKTYEIETMFAHIFNLLKAANISKITLINNAGTLGKIGPLQKLDVATIESTIKLNTVVPFICSAAFIKLTDGWTAKKTIINISSGAALKPYFGWSMYCSSKAAVNMLTQTLATEQAHFANGVKVLAIAPGVVDTDMQTQIRSSSKVDFKDIDRFISLKNDGDLFDAAYVGEQICKMDYDYSIESGSVLRVESD